METIEQITQERDKLQERLNNAAKFFREQKAQIETLTKENEELKNQINRTPQEEVIDVEKWNALVTEKENFENVAANKQKVIEKLENDIESKDKAYKVLQDTYNEVFSENEKLKSEAINTKVPELETKLNNANAAYEELRKKYAELKELHDGDLKRYNELEDNYEGLQNKYKENDIAKGEAELKVEALQAEYEKKFVEQEEQLNTAKNAVEKTVKKFEQLREANNLLQDKSVEMANDVKKYQTKYNDEHLLAEEFKKQIQELRDESNNQLKELEEVKANREEFRSQLVDLEKKYDQLNKLYDDCEAEKLYVQADCDKLQEKIKYIEANNISDKEWQDHLENVIEQIRNLADDVINPKPVSNENKENVMKRTGDYNVSGENIGI